MENINRNEIFLSVVRAMLGNISIHVRAITIDWVENTFHIKSYFDREPEEDDIEDISRISTEVLADFINFKNENVECIYSQEPLNNLDVLNEWVFIRKEL